MRRTIPVFMPASESELQSVAGGRTLRSVPSGLMTRRGHVPLIQAALLASSGQFQAVAEDGEPFQPFHESVQGSWGKLTRHVHDTTAGQTAGVVMRFGSGIIPRWSVAVRQLEGQSTVDEGLEGLVHSGERDPGDGASDLLKDLVGGGMSGGPQEESVDCRSLGSEALARLREGLVEAMACHVGRALHQDRSTPEVFGSGFLRKGN
jgi:hypothetical protein